MIIVVFVLGALLMYLGYGTHFTLQPLGHVGYYTGVLLVCFGLCIVGLWLNERWDRRLLGRQQPAE